MIRSNERAADSISQHHPRLLAGVSEHILVHGNTGLAPDRLAASLRGAVLVEESCTADLLAPHCEGGISELDLSLFTARESARLLLMDLWPRTSGFPANRAAVCIGLVHGYASRGDIGLSRDSSRQLMVGLLTASSRLVVDYFDVQDRCDVQGSLVTDMLEVNIKLGLAATQTGGPT